MTAPLRQAQRISKALLAILASALLGVGLGGIANAFWTSGGGGPGSAATTTTEGIVLSPGIPTTRLYPGGTSDVSLTVANPNGFPVRIGSLALDAAQGDAGFTVDSAHLGCALSTLSFTTQTNTGTGWAIPARVGSNNGSLSIVLANALSMGAGATNVCQGAAFTVAMTAGG